MDFLFFFSHYWEYISSLLAINIKLVFIISYQYWNIKKKQRKDSTAIFASTCALLQEDSAQHYLRDKEKSITQHNFSIICFINLIFNFGMYRAWIYGFFKIIWPKIPFSLVLVLSTVLLRRTPALNSQMFLQYYL